MRRVLTAVLLAAAFLAVTGATCGKPKPLTVAPEQQLKFTDEVYYHNMGIAWDGEFYYTVNGGSPDYGKVNKYDESGELIESYEIETDGRSIMYSPEEEGLYIKPYGQDLLSVDLDLEETSTESEGIFQSEQTSVAMSPDGLKLYELSAGEVYVYDMDLGEEEESFTLEHYSSTDELGFSYAIAASDRFLFVWGPDTEKEVYVYTLNGKYVTRFELPRKGFGFSLSWANGMLWVSKDADASTDGGEGTWYGYELKGLE
jgi:WD40 repeat protein